MIWDPDLYGRYAAARRRPAEELLARVRHPNPRLVVDLGCGRGEMARAMAIRWPAATVLGVDRSEEMLAAAAAEEGRVRWVHAAIERWRPPGPVDVLFSNAALHWLPDHAGLLPELVDTLAPGGVLAVQMPLSWDEPSHRALREVLAAGGVDRRPWGSDRLRSRYGRRPVADPEWYEELLRPRLEELDIWVTRYLHVLDGADPVLSWVAGSLLRPLLGELDAPAREAFLERYRECLRHAYPRRADGTTLFPFPRLFIVGRRSHTPA